MREGVICDLSHGTGMEKEFGRQRTWFQQFAGDPRPPRGLGREPGRPARGACRRQERPPEGGAGDKCPARLALYERTWFRRVGMRHRWQRTMCASGGGKNKSSASAVLVRRLEACM